MDAKTKASLDALFKPSSVAIIGASANPAKLGNLLLRNLLEGGTSKGTYNRAFKGKIFAVNPGEKEILGIPCYPTVKDIPQPVDLIVIAVPAAHVNGVIQDACARGVKTAIVLSAGFGEAGPEGVARQEEMLKIAKAGGLRIVGPNCLGVVRAQSHLNAAFSPSMPPEGGTAFVSQSGAILVGVLDWATSANHGLSSLVSIGNAADLDPADFVEWLSDDPATTAITLYVEGLTRGRDFLDAVRKAVAKKPVIVLKGGRSASGSKAAASHTGSMAGSPAVFEGLMRQYGAVMADSVEEMMDLADALRKLPKPKGENLAVVTNAGGIGVCLTDYLSSSGLNPMTLRDETVAKLEATKTLPASWSHRNPVDVVGDAKADRYKAAIDVLLAEPDVHQLLVAQIVDSMTEPEGNARAVVEAHQKHPDKPIVCAFLGGELSSESIKIVAQAGIPVFVEPRRAARAFLALNGKI